MLKIDGSHGEGGGQIVRSSLALSLVTGQPVTVANVRAARAKPGLRRQHLTAVHAAVELGGATVQGAAIGSSSLVFSPGPVRPGEYTFRIGTAGSATLVLQTVLPALLLADCPSRLTLEGGTHNPLAPPFDFLAEAYLPLVNRLGPTVRAMLLRPGFYPAGGGQFVVELEPAKQLVGCTLLERGRLIRRSIIGCVARLPTHIAQRECDEIVRQSNWESECCEIRELHDSAGPGNVVMVRAEYEQVTEIFTGFGKLGVRAETVAENLWREAREYFATDAPVGPYLADQLLLPLGLAAHAGASSQFRTLPLTPHAETHIHVLRQFLNINVHAEQLPDHTVVVKVQPS